MSKLTGDFKVSSGGVRKVNVKDLGDDVRREILRRVKDKLGFNKTVEILDISKRTPPQLP
jgi:hypothetical protein